MIINGYDIVVILTRWRQHSISLLWLFGGIDHGIDDKIIRDENT